MYEYDNSFVYMPLEAAQLYLPAAENAVDALEVMVDDPDHVLRRSAARSSRRSAAGFRLIDWQQRQLELLHRDQVERNVMFLILTLIILVAAFNIISSLIMLVKDKGRDIAILRTMGATRGMIMRIFLMSGASIGIVGTLAGLRPRPPLLRQHRDDPAVAAGADAAPTLFPPRSISSRSCRRSVDPRRGARRGRAWRSGCRCWPRSIRPGARRGSIRWRRCAMSDAALPACSRRSSDWSRCATCARGDRGGPCPSRP